MEQQSIDQMRAGSTWSTLAQTLRLAGFEPSDFEISEGAPEGLRAMGLPDRLLTLRRRSTGHRQLYATSPGCPWLFNAFADLTAGRFGVPPEGSAMN